MVEAEGYVVVLDSSESAADTRICCTTAVESVGERVVFLTGWKTWYDRLMSFYLHCGLTGTQS